MAHESAAETPPEDVDDSLKLILGLPGEINAFVSPTSAEEATNFDISSHDLMEPPRKKQKLPAMEQQHEGLATVHELRSPNAMDPVAAKENQRQDVNSMGDMQVQRTVKSKKKSRNKAKKAAKSKQQANKDAVQSTSLRRTRPEGSENEDPQKSKKRKASPSLLRFLMCSNEEGPPDADALDDMDTTRSLSDHVEQDSLSTEDKQIDHSEGLLRDPFDDKYNPRMNHEELEDMEDQSNTKTQETTSPIDKVMEEDSLSMDIEEMDVRLDELRSREENGLFHIDNSMDVQGTQSKEEDFAMQPPNQMNEAVQDESNVPIAETVDNQVVDMAVKSCGAAGRSMEMNQNDEEKNETILASLNTMETIASDMHEVNVPVGNDEAANLEVDQVENGASDERKIEEDSNTLEPSHGDLNEPPKSADDNEGVKNIESNPEATNESPSIINSEKPLDEPVTSLLPNVLAHEIHDDLYMDSIAVDADVGENNVDDFQEVVETAALNEAMDAQVNQIGETLHFVDNPMVAISVTDSKQEEYSPLFPREDYPLSPDDGYWSENELNSESEVNNSPAVLEAEKLNQESSDMQNERPIEELDEHANETLDGDLNGLLDGIVKEATAKESHPNDEQANSFAHEEKVWADSLDTTPNVKVDELFPKGEDAAKTPDTLDAPATEDRKPQSYFSKIPAPSEPMVFPRKEALIAAEFGDLSSSDSNSESEPEDIQPPPPPPSPPTQNPVVDLSLTPPPDSPLRLQAKQLPPHIYNGKSVRPSQESMSPESSSHSFAGSMSDDSPSSDEDVQKSPIAPAPRKQPPYMRNRVPRTTSKTKALSSTQPSPMPKATRKQPSRAAQLFSSPPPMASRRKLPRRELLPSKPATPPKPTEEDSDDDVVIVAVKPPDQPESLHPVLRGVYKITDEGAVWSGTWGFVDTTSKAQTRFSYRIARNDEEWSLDAPKSGYYNGYFFMQNKPTAKPQRINENRVHLEFTPLAKDTYMVDGTGRNTIGGFYFRGYFEWGTMLTLKKMYE